LPSEWYEKAGRGWYLQSWLPGSFFGESIEGFRWTTLYFFKPQATFNPDYWQLNWYVSTFPEARFVGEEVAFRYLRTAGSSSGTASFSRTPEHRKRGEHGVLRVRFGIVAELEEVQTSSGILEGMNDETDEVPEIFKVLWAMEANGEISPEPALSFLGSESKAGKLAIYPATEEAKWKLLGAIFGLKRMADLARS
jgi:hypothetical protein